MLKDHDIAIMKDMWEFCRACLRIIALHDLLDELMVEMDRLKIEPGFGIKFKELIERQQGE